MSARLSQDEIHERAWELLPWLANGRLDADDESWLAPHVAGCDECRREVDMQKALRAGFAADARVEYAPQASFQKLMTRIDELGEEQSAEPQAPRQAVASRMPRWLLGTLAAQGAFVLVVAAFVGWQTFERFTAPNYQTLTSADPAVSLHGNLRVVLAPSVTLGEFESLVEGLHARVVAGPTSAHVWTLAVRFAPDSQEFASMLRELRTDERIVFAEPVASAGIAP